MDPSVGELAVSHELDMLNHRFQALLNMLIDQLKNLALVNTDDHDLQVIYLSFIVLINHLYDLFYVMIVYFWKYNLSEK